MKIFKYPLKPNGKTIFKTHEVFYPLSVGFQKYDLCLWAAVDECSPQTKEVEFLSVTTGESFKTHGNLDSCLGRAMTEDHEYVVHVFRLK